MPDWLLHNILAPTNVEELINFYLIWILLFLSINIIWDIKTTKTPVFHFTSLAGKAALLHPASFFCSSLLIIVACKEPDVWKLAEEIKIPILLTGFSGVLTSIVAFCPYPYKTPDNEG